MAIFSVIRYHGPLPYSSQAAEVPGGRHRLLHKMSGSRSRSLSRYHGKEYLEFCLEEHHLQGLLFGARNQEPLLVARPPPSQRIGRGYETILAQDRIWPEELPSVLWAYQTTARTPTGETPFLLAYGSEVVIPAKVGFTSYKVDNHDERKNDETMRLQLDLLDEVRATAEQRLARYQNLMAKHYNSRVRHKDFQVGDLILMKVMGASKDPT
ncbi:uncharacterized protein LOC126705006 [Quercus robur]|uniref:uncharacterized protein LOC126705006 n=1 Tax=Quercus robur TaxID=38942 RepID=UPI002161FDE7|nr:uncharacterized protein LOC126705006 [Quercus robur]